MQVRQGRVFRQGDVLSALQRAVAAADQDVGQGVIVVAVAVAHVRAIQEHRMIQQRAIAIGCRRHLGDEVRKALHVVALDLHQLVQALHVIGVVRQGVERIRHANVVVGAIGAFRHHHVSGHARQVGLVGERQQVELQLHLRIEVVQFAGRCLGQFRSADVLRLRLLHAALDLPHAFQVVVERDPISGAQIALEGSRTLLDQVQDARSLLHQRGALFGGVAFAEELRKHLARVVFHRQRRVRVAERQRAAVIAAAGAAAAAGYLQRGL